MHTGVAQLILAQIQINQGWSMLHTLLQGRGNAIIGTNLAQLDAPHVRRVSHGPQNGRRVLPRQRRAIEDDLLHCRIVTAQGLEQVQQGINVFLEGGRRCAIG